MRDTGESNGSLRIVIAAVVVAALIAGGYYLKKHAQSKDREAELAKAREERKRNADPAKVLRDAQRMEEISRHKAEQERGAPR